MAEVDDALVTMEWRDILTATWAVHPSLLAALVPAGTTLDLWNGDALLSLVGARVLDSRIAGVPVPLHQDFDHIDLRFHVRRQLGSATRRGVVFIRQIVPSVSMTLLGRLLYNERCLATETRRDLQPGEQGWTVYEWLVGNRWNRLSAVRAGEAAAASEHTIDEFLVDRPWAYSRQADGSTMEFHAEHPRWDVWPTKEMLLDCDVAPLFGSEFVAALSSPPISTFVAVGSAVSLGAGRLMTV
jgi:uncharacterized protein YqjF (DUF2071 family)